MELEKILEELKYNRGKFPHKAIEEATKSRDQIIPRLVDTLIYSKEHIDSLIEDEDYYAHIFAMFLLAQFKEKSAFKPLIDLFSIPGETIGDFTGDILTESFSRILASVYNGDISLLKSMIENKNIHEYVRSSGLETLTILVSTGEMKRAEVISYFKELFDAKLERYYSHVWNTLVGQCILLYPEELYDDIKTAYDNDLVESTFVGLEDVEEILETKNKEDALNDIKNDIHFNLIDENSIKELSNWACFGDRNEQELNLNNISTSDFKPSNSPHVRKSEKIGRNAPCPCGSGKKYKKCCIFKST